MVTVPAPSEEAPHVEVEFSLALGKEFITGITSLVKVDYDQLKKKISEGVLDKPKKK